MALQASALSIAADNIAALVAQHFQDLGEEVVTSVDSPVAASKRADGANAKDCVNFFFYRVAPAGFNAWRGSGDPLFLRLFCLVTPFPSKAANAHNEADADLRLLGQVIRLLNSRPVLPGAGSNPWPDPAGANDTRYRVEAVLLAPNMEEINHIWTTQGTELPYKLSAVYEFAIVPVDPLVRATVGPPVREAVVQVDPTMDTRIQITTVPHIRYSEEARALPMRPRPGDAPLAAPWMPLALFIDGTQLTNTRHVPAATATVPVALAGLPGGKARLTLTWFAGNATITGSSVVVRDVATGRLDAASACFDLALAPPANSVRLRVEPAPAANDGSALPGALTGTAIELTLDGA